MAPNKLYCNNQSAPGYIYICALYMYHFLFLLGCSLGVTDDLLHVGYSKLCKAIV